MEEAKLTAAWMGALEKVFPNQAALAPLPADVPLYTQRSAAAPAIKAARPRVVIPAFPGTNCEDDAARAFVRAGAQTIVKVFKNLDGADIRDSVEEFARAIQQSQILMFPGGFSAGDEPEGSAKFFANVFRNERIKEAVSKLLDERERLSGAAQAGAFAVRRNHTAKSGLADTDLQYDRAPYFQDGIYKGRIQ